MIDTSSCSNVRRYWTRAEEQQLIDIWYAYKPKVVARKLGRSVRSCQERILKLNGRVIPEGCESLTKLSKRFGISASGFPWCLNVRSVLEWAGVQIVSKRKHLAYANVADATNAMNRLSKTENPTQAAKRFGVSHRKLVAACMKYGYQRPAVGLWRVPSDMLEWIVTHGAVDLRTRDQIELAARGWRRKTQNGTVSVDNTGAKANVETNRCASPGTNQAGNGTGTGK